MLDLLDYLQIQYKTSGKNVTGGWVEVCCPFAGCSDPSFHLGINLQSGKYSCWICNSKGGSEKLIMNLASISYREAKSLINKFSDDIVYSEEEKEAPIITGNILPKEATTELPALHRNYLIGRGFDPDYIQKKYGILACYTTGDYAYRIIIPIIINNILVNFTARDVSGQQEPKYLHCPNNRSILPIKDCLYNVDTIKKKAIIVEGPTDVWRIGDGCCATMGTEYTRTQLSILALKELKEAYVLFDADATKTTEYNKHGEIINLGPSKAEKLAMIISAFCPKVEVIELDSGDPGDMDETEVKKLRKEIGI